MHQETSRQLALETGPSRSSDELLPLVYDELRHLAAVRLAHERPGQTLQATALVHEAYLRMQRHPGAAFWQDDRHFFNAAAEAMRHILIDNARRKRALRHGGNLVRADIAEIEPSIPTPPDELLALDEALERMATIYPEEAQLVKLRYFIGATQEEAARILGVSRRTVNTRWSLARAWLYRAMRNETPLPR
jgi:RNA polymerase sigma factor (TIGR02999 family)